jgi:hypothetical protein
MDAEQLEPDQRALVHAYKVPFQGRRATVKQIRDIYKLDEVDPQSLTEYDLEDGTNAPDYEVIEEIYC